MSLMKEVQQLEDNIFNSLEAALKAIENRDFPNAKAYLVAVEELNKDYKKITYVDFVQSKVILNAYERLWSKQNA